MTEAAPSARSAVRAEAGEAAAARGHAQVGVLRGLRARRGAGAVRPSRHAAPGCCDPTLSVVVLFGTSALYHRIDWGSVARRWMRRLDHSAIFLLIAGTYAVRPAGARRPLATVILVVVWAGALSGIVMKLVWIDAPKPVVAIAYVMLGWVAVAAFPDLIEELGVTGVGLIVAGARSTPPELSCTRSSGPTRRRRSSAITRSSTCS